MRAFIIRPFGVKQGIDFDRTVRELIDPALKAVEVTGRDTIEILKQGNIRIDMFQRLLTADLVVADLSIHNANVFYELGIRHALRGKRTFLLRSDQDAYPFDLQTDRYLIYDKDDPGASLDILIQALRETLSSEDHDSPVFRSLPELREPDRSQCLAVPGGFREEVERTAEKGTRGDLGMLAPEAEGFGWESEGLRIVGRAQCNLADYDGARTTWESIRRIDTADLEADTLLGTIYHRLGRFPESDQALKRILDRKGVKPHGRSEAYALLGRNAKARWKEEWQEESVPEIRRNKALRSAFLEISYQGYSRGFNTDLNHFYPGLNALAMLTILIEMAQTLPDVWSERFEEEWTAERELESLQVQREKLAIAVETSIAAAKARLEHEEEIDIWVEISDADLCCLTSKRPARVATTYRKALAGSSDFDKRAVRDQLHIYHCLGVLTANVDAARLALRVSNEEESTQELKTPRVLLFAGHMIDAPGRREPRFPPENESSARQAIHDAIKVEQRRAGGVAFGIAGGASGGDILFHEICADLGIPTRLYLALPSNQYVETSVVPAGGNWIDRFDRLTERLPVRVLAESPKLPSWLVEKPDYNIWQRNNLWMLHNALAEGGQQTTLIALWNGQKGDGPGSIGDLVARAKERYARTVILDSNRL
jgi:tetratricopeptide (TPR) repeat protein